MDLKARLTVSLLGEFRVRVGDEELNSSFRTAKEKALFAYLLIENVAPVRREFLAELLWPDRPENNALTNLRQALYGLRLSFGRDTAPPHFFITDTTVQFNRLYAGCIDVKIFREKFALASDLLQSGAAYTCDFRTALEEALEQYQGEFLADLYAEDCPDFLEWLTFQRERFFHMYLIVLRQLTDYHFDRGELNQALQYARTEVLHAPLEEAGHRRLMQMLAGLGRRSAALEQFQACRSMLLEEFGIPPTQETLNLVENIRSGANTAPAKAEPGTDLSSPRSAIPTPLTSFIGRESEVAELTKCLKNPQCRLVTLIGMGGVGKSRIAIEAASAVVAGFRDGLWYLAIDGEVTPEKLEQCIRRTTGVTGGREEMLDFFRLQHGLLFIDPSDSLTGAARVLLDILRTAPHVKILVTSRDRIQYQSACVFDIPPMACPESGDPDTLIDYSSVQLFLTRQQHRQGRPLNANQDPESLLQICRSLQGLPLAIELAAAQAERHTLTDVAAALSRDLNILETGQRDVPARHRSIQALFEPGWRRLSETEKRALQECTAFKSSFSVEETGADQDVLDGLANKSMLSKPAPHRYALHPVVRAFVLHQSR